MGFFFNDTAPQRGNQTKLPEHTAKQLKCAVCPLNKVDAKHPKLEPQGTDKPIIYTVFPSITNPTDLTGTYYEENGEKYLLDNIPADLHPYIRTSSLLRCYPLGKKPNDICYTCCRDFLEQDVQATQPFLIIGVGETVLNKLTNIVDGSKYREQAVPLKWRGRVFPITIGTHTCWYYQVLHPTTVIMLRKRYENEQTGTVKVLESELDAVFRRDLKHVAELVDALPDAPDYKKEDFTKGIVCCYGKTDENLAQVLDWLDELRAYNKIAIDIETNQLRPYWKNSRLLSLAIGTFDKCYVFPYEYRGAWNADQLAVLKEAIKDFLLTSGLKIGHNVKFEQEWLEAKFGPVIRNTKWGCTQGQAYAIDERRGMLSLDVLTRIYFGFWLKELSNIDRSRMEDYPLEEILPYNGMDTKWTFLLFEKQRELINQSKELQQVYNFLNRSLPTLVLAQAEGLSLNEPLILQYGVELQEQVTKASRQIRTLPEVVTYNRNYGQYNPDSPDDLLTLLTKVLELDEVLKNKYGKHTTDEVVLSQLADTHDLARLTLELRAARKKNSTYIEPLLSIKSDIDNRIHTNFNIYETRTGRLSSSEPALQNWPYRKGKEIRRVIVPPKGWFILSGDYGQIEARIVGLLSQDSVLCNALWENYDVHMEWAQRIAMEYPRVIGGKRNLNDPAIMKRFRGDIKNQWTFPAIYGASYKSIARYLKIPESTIKPLFDEFWRMFSGIKQWQHKTKKFYEQFGYVETLTKKRRHGPLTWNELCNSPIQGSAADLCVHAMNKLSELQHESIRPILNIHDDITCYVREEAFEEAVAIQAEIMATAPNDLIPGINIPIAVELSVGENWCDKEDAGTYYSTDFLKVPRTLRAGGF